MSQFHPRIFPENPKNSELRTQRLCQLYDDIIAAYDRRLPIDYDDISTTGSVADIYAVEYLYYEQLLSPPLFADKQDVCLTTAMLLGAFLVRHLGFSWCQSSALPDSPCQVYRDSDGLYLNLPSFIAHKWHLRGDMNFDFENVIVDIITMHHLHSIDDHPMTALGHGLIEKDDYIRRFGYYPPDRVVELFGCCYDKYHEDVFYQLGLSVFELTGTDEEWQQIVRLLENMIE